MRLGKSAVIWLLAFIFLTIVMGYMEQKNFDARYETLAFSEFMNQVESQKVSNVVISGAKIYGETIDGRKFATYAPQSPSMVDKLLAHGVKIEAEPEENAEGSFWAVIISWLPKSAAP